MKKNIIQISISKSRIKGRIKQVNELKYSNRIVLPKEAGRLKGHVFLISEDFCVQHPKDESKIVMNFYANQDIHLSRPFRTEEGMIYEKVVVSPKELKEFMKEDMELIPKVKAQSFSEEEIEYLKENISALEFMQDHVGFSFTKQGSGYYRCDQHNSLVIDTKKNILFWNSRGIKGNVLHYLQVGENKTFPEALQVMKEYHNALPEDKKVYTVPKFEQVKFQLPTPAPNNQSVIKYLTQDRAIRRDVLSTYVKNGLIYQDEKGNAVFVSQDYKGEKDAAFLRSTFSGFRGDVAGGNKFTGFYIECCPGAKKLVLTEAYIDGLSYLSYKMNQGEKIDFNILGCDSAAVMNETFRRNYLLREDLKNNLDTIVFAADNDTGGLKALDSFKEFIKPFHFIKNVEVDMPEQGSDWNQQLKKSLEVNPIEYDQGIFR